MIAHIFNIAVGLTFSGGFIDLLMFGILQGNSKTSWDIINSDWYCLLFSLLYKF